MLLLQIQLQVERETPFGPAESPFKGGILHGLVEAALSRHSPQLWARLRGPANHIPHYALQVPQDSLSHWPVGHCFELGIMLYAPVQALWADVLTALTQGPPLRLGRARSPCTALDVRVHRPDAPSLSLLQAMGHAGQALPHWRPSAPDVREQAHLTLHLLAPCLISSEGRRQHPQLAASPYTLTSVVRSVQRRMQVLEPELATHYRFDHPTWTQACQSLAPLRLANQHHLTPQPWPYISRNTPGQHPVTIHALRGHMRYSGPIPAPIASLLHIGQWLGLGQKNSLGMGWYGVETDSTHDTTKGD